MYIIKYIKTKYGELKNENNGYQDEGLDGKMAYFKFAIFQAVVVQYSWF